MSGVQVAAVRLLGVPSLANFILLILHLIFLCPNAAPFLPLELIVIFFLAVGFGLGFLYHGLPLVHSFVLVLISLILVKTPIIALPAVVLRKIVAAALTLKKLATSASGAVGTVIVVVIRRLSSHLILVRAIVASFITVVISFIITRALAALTSFIAVAQGPLFIVKKLALVALVALIIASSTSLVETLVPAALAIFGETSVIVRVRLSVDKLARELLLLELLFFLWLKLKLIIGCKVLRLVLSRPSIVQERAIVVWLRMLWLYRCIG